MKARFIEVLTQLSDACDQHKDELLARTKFYENIADTINETHEDYFEQHSFVLQPVVPNAIIPILMQLRELYKDFCEEMGADQIASTISNLISNEEELIEQIIPDTQFLYHYLQRYVYATDDERFQFFTYMGHGIAATKLNIDKNWDANQIPLLVLSHEQSYCDNQMLIRHAFSSSCYNQTTLSLASYCGNYKTAGL